MSTAALNIRLDSELKEGAASAAPCYGLDLSSAVRASSSQMVRTHSIPLDLTDGDGDPNAESLEAIKEADGFFGSGARGRFSTADEMFSALEA